MKFKLIAAAVFAAGVSHVANASVVLATDPAGNGNLGGSELVFNMWDGTNTYSLDLGVTMGSFTAPAANVPVNVNLFASDPKAALFFTGGVLNSNVQWGVMAADNVAAAPAGNTSATALGTRILTTSTSATWTYNNANTGASGNALSSFIGALNFLPDHLNTPNGSDLSTSVLDSASWQGSGMLSTWVQNGQFTAMGTGPGSLLFVQATQSYTGTAPRFSSSAAAAPLFNTMGQFSLAANGQLTFAPVPLPAAVWLFGSALMGLVGVARRRNEMA